VQPASSGNHVPEVARYFTVARILRYLSNQFSKPSCRQLVDFHELTYAVMGNSRGNTRLVIPDWDRNHGHSLSQRLEGRVQARMRDAQGHALQQLELRSRPHDDRIRWDRPQLLELDILPHREHQLSLRKLLDCFENRPVHMEQTIHQSSQRPVDQRRAGQSVPRKCDWLSSLIVVKRSRVVKLRRPGSAGKIK